MKPSLHLNCKKATEMVEQQTVVRLSFWGNLKLKLHLAICSACKTYHRQSLAIDQFFKEHTEESMKEDEIDKTKTLKHNIISNLNKL